MIISDPTFIYLLVVSNAALLAAGCIAILRFQGQRQELEEFWSSPTGTSLADTTHDDIERLAQSNRRLEKRLEELQGAVAALAHKEAVSLPSVERSLPIENAIRMAQKGASVDELTRSCGLNVGEARLMHKMHGNIRVIENRAQVV